MNEQTKPEVTIKKEDAVVYYINDPKHSYGVFCFNSSGDFFMNSDWGFYGYAWRAFAKDFKDFLAYTDPDYIFQKFANNMAYVYGKNLPRRKNLEPHVIELIKIFQAELKREISEAKADEAYNETRKDDFEQKQP